MQRVKHVHLSLPMCLPILAARVLGPHMSHMALLPARAQVRIDWLQLDARLRQNIKAPSHERTSIWMESSPFRAALSVAFGAVWLAAMPSLALWLQSAFR